MRTFEVVLILVNLLSLVLSLKKQSKAVWAGIAGVNLSVFLIHGIFEGFRYQMVFSYIFIVLFTVYALVKTNDKFYNAKMPKALKIIAISLAFVFLGFTSFLAYALPVFTLPKPTGSYNVGIKYFHLVDENRTDPFLDKSTQKRELMVKVYYPAQKDDSKPFSPYFHNSPELIRLYVASLGLPDFLGDHLNLVKTNSKENLQLSDKQHSYPVILFSHGAGTTMEVQTSQSEDLASHGYIVVTIDHTYVSAATIFPDRIASTKEATAEFNLGDTTEIMSQVMTADTKFVIEKLGEMNAGKIDSIFKGKLDLNKMGIIGHSLGGSVAYNLAINDSRVKAAIDLDGDVYITPNGDPTNIAPFLMLASDHNIQLIKNREPLMMMKLEGSDEERKKSLALYGGSEEAYNEAYDKAQQNIIGLTEVLKASGNLFAIEGSGHLEFTDIGLFLDVHQLLGEKTDPARCLEITKAVTLAFFDQYLKGETRDSLEPLLKKYPELKRIDLQ